MKYVFGIGPLCLLSLCWGTEGFCVWEKVTFCCVEVGGEHRFKLEYAHIQCYNFRMSISLEVLGQ